MAMTSDLSAQFPKENFSSSFFLSAGFYLFFVFFLKAANSGDFRHVGHGSHSSVKMPLTTVFMGEMKSGGG